jgi:hypothetical protein
MEMKYIVLILLLIAGCNSPELELSDNTASNVSAVAAYIPVGTDSTTAIKRMSDADFACTIERDKTSSISKGTSIVGRVGPVDFIYCDKQQGIPVVHRWQVTLILDDKDKVKDYSVTTGLVGP